MRLIDVDALHGRLDDLRDGLDAKFDMLMPEGLVRATIDGMPTVEPPRWISVDERLPDAEGDVLVWDKLIDAQDIDRFINGAFWNYGKFVTHWMPLPEPPEVKSIEN